MNLLIFYAEFYVRANIHCSGRGFQVFVGFSQYVCVIQNRLKTIVYAPVICADVIPGVGTLPKTQELHYV